MSSSKRRVVFGVEGADKTRIYMAPESSTIGDFLNLIKQRQGRDDLAHVWLDGSELFEDDTIGDAWTERALFYASASEDPPSRDTIDNLQATRSAPPVPAAQPPQSSQLLQTAQTPTDESGLSNLINQMPARTASGGAAKSLVRKPADPAPIPAGHVRLFTTLSLDSMISGHDIIVPSNLTAPEIIVAIAPVLEAVGAPAPFQADLYLPGGIPFRGGTLADALASDAFKSGKPLLYAVVSRATSGPRSSRSCATARPTIGSCFCRRHPRQRPSGCRRSRRCSDI
jgi:hypothetical protein